MNPHYPIALDARDGAAREDHDEVRDRRDDRRADDPRDEVAGVDDAREHEHDDDEDGRDADADHGSVRLRGQRVRNTGCLDRQAFAAEGVLDEPERHADGREPEARWKPSERIAVLGREGALEEPREDRPEERTEVDAR